WGATLPPPPPHFLLPPALLTRARLSTLEATLVSPADGMLALHVGDRFLLAEALPGEEALRRLLDKYAAAGMTLHLQEGKLLPLPSLNTALARRLSASLAWWLRRLLPFCHFLLQEALGEEQWAPERLLAQRGRVSATRTHVDLLMPLEAIDISVRRAGLDRSPGWQPALARVITFSFQGQFT
ncbi:MAG: hypothetical protein R3272_13115, partial [Candidatus Promineifilaceae bacterium]|nr:hypothetical protein [Candidatus Promineifilaceae bacterium]